MFSILFEDESLFGWGLKYLDVNGKFLVEDVYENEWEEDYEEEFLIWKFYYKIEVSEFKCLLFLNCLLIVCVFLLFFCVVFF